MICDVLLAIADCTMQLIRGKLLILSMSIIDMAWTEYHKRLNNA